ncbi:DUF3159 domain-containing protein [Haloglycomyces albus]|uniref:DUF3159 domain-containing protein n=1 Tax=Haloglycomyces albus TaxID=526067 RepID=UPI00046CCD04|nr:DUF3159 domain-containing protein [Haloglycomyces albus]
MAIDSNGTRPEDELPPFTEQLSQQLGGARGVIEAAVPLTVFIVLNPLLPDQVGPFEGLHVAITTAVLAALAIAGFRLIRKESVRYALNGLFGVAIGAVLAWKTGEARNFYIWGVIQGLIYGFALIGSSLVRHPIVGWLYAILSLGGKKEWREDKSLLRVMSFVTVVWGVVFLLKNVLRLWLYQIEAEEMLGLATLVGGWPVTALLVVWTIWMVKRRLPHLAQRSTTAD